MSKLKMAEELFKHENHAITVLDSYISNLIESGDPKKMGKADKLSYWIEDWTKFLDYEPHFSPQHLKRYKRGEILKLHLGFNIGSEEGGLHYAVVLDKENSIHSPVVTIIPLTSVKPNKDLDKLRNGEVFLGNELYNTLFSKYSSHLHYLQERLAWIENELSDLSKMVGQDNPAFSDRLKLAQSEQAKNIEELALTKKLKAEINKMKTGSIALVNQITTVSKIRIYDPKTNHDILGGIKLSNEKLDLIDNEIFANFTNAKIDNI